MVNCCPNMDSLQACLMSRVHRLSQTQNNYVQSVDPLRICVRMEKIQWFFSQLVAEKTLHSVK